MRNKTNPDGISGWLAGGLTAPIAYLAGHDPWLVVLLIGAACFGFSKLVSVLWNRQERNVKWLWLLQAVWAGVLVGQFARWSGQCWPTGDAFPLVPLALLILSVFAGWDGVERASQIGRVMVWFLIALFAVVFGSGLGNLKLEFITPQFRLPTGELVAVLLLPATAAFLPGSGRCSLTKLGVVLAFAVVACVGTIGTLSQGVADETAFAFYEFSKSLSLFGVVERFEAFVSVAVTLGFFSILSYLVSLIGVLTEKSFPGKQRYGVVGGAVFGGAVALFIPQIPACGMLLVSLSLWVIMPLLACAMSSIKKVKKYEKNT